MKTSLFEYELPENMIAQHPPEDRGTSRLLVLDRGSGKIRHKSYSDVAQYVREGDVVVLNETKVMTARIFAIVERTGREVEVLFLRREYVSDSGSEKEEYWYCLIGRARHVKIGDKLNVGRDVMMVADRRDGDRGFIISVKDALSLMDEHGEVPLPPYIKRKPTDEDSTRYNTIFGQERNSVAAPTASLNLTSQILESIESKHAEIAYVNLHVGLGTFIPVGTEEIEEHAMHSELVSVPQDTVEKINDRRGRVWAFGTTVVRALESAAVGSGEIGPLTGETDLYIYPGYGFKIVDVLVTNFHVPRSSLIMLVSAFAGREHVLDAYESAKQEGYRFLSYGDSMLIGDFGHSRN